MTRRRAPATLVCLALAAASLAACGGSSNREHASAGIAGATRPTTSTTAPPTTRTSSAPTGTSTPSTPAETTTTGASGARLPATFTVAAGGGLSPPSVTAPAGVPIELTVISGDGNAHQIVLGSPHPHTLSVPASGRASAAVTGLKAGRYPITIDGAAKGTLVIGGQPGP